MSAPVCPACGRVSGPVCMGPHEALAAAYLESIGEGQLVRRATVGDVLTAKLKAAGYGRRTRLSGEELAALCEGVCSVSYARTIASGLGIHLVGVQRYIAAARGHRSQVTGQREVAS